MADKKLYKVTKIFDKRSEKAVFDTRMCGQAAFRFRAICSYSEDPERGK